MAKSKIQNVEQLRDELLDTLEGIKSGSIRVADAKERSNCAGKIINTAKLQLEYAALRKETPNIAFLNTK